MGGVQKVGQGSVWGTEGGRRLWVGFKVQRRT